MAAATLPWADAGARPVKHEQPKGLNARRRPPLADDAPLTLRARGGTLRASDFLTRLGASPTPAAAPCAARGGDAAKP